MVGSKKFPTFVSNNKDNEVMSNAMKLGQMSRNKLTKKQLAELRKRKYIFFERSYENCLFHLTYCKAVIRSFHKDTDVFKYSIERIKKMYDLVHETYVKELKTLGYITDNNFHYLNLSMPKNKKLRNIKITIINPKNLVI